MMQHEQEYSQSGDGAGVRSGWGSERWETREERTFVAMRNDLTVIRGQAQLVQRALSCERGPDAHAVNERLAAIISSVDAASLELQQLQSSMRGRRQRI